MSDLLSTIKQAAVEAVEASNPVQVVFGKVVKSSPLLVSVEQKLPLDEDFLVIPSGIKKEGLKENDGLILLREQGGQRFFIMGKM